MSDLGKFRKKFVEATAGIDEETVCSLLKERQVTVERWSTGETMPHEFGQRAIFETLAKYKEEE